MGGGRFVVPSGVGSGVGPFRCPKAVSMPASRRKRRLTPESISQTLKKIAFFDSGAIFGVFRSPQRPFFAVRTLLKIPLLFEKKSKNEKFLADFLEILLSYPGMFFGPPGTI